MRKITTIIMILVLSFAMVFIYPTKQASANPLAVGGALYLGGAGVYVLGAVGIGAIAGIAGCSSCQEDIEAHAARTWDGTTQLAKDGLQLMIDSSVGAWGATSSALTATDANFNTWMDSIMNDYSSGLYNAINGGNNVYLDGTLYTAQTVNTGTVGTKRSEIVITNGSKDILVNGIYYDKITLIASHTSTGASNFYVSLFNATGTTKIMIDVSKYSIDIIRSLQNAATNVGGVLGLFSYVGIYASVHSSTAKQEYANVVSSTREAWQDMEDAGLVLPTDNARAMHGDVPLTYDPVTDAYAGIDGVNVPRDEITFDYQKPHWKTLEDLAMLGLSGLGAGLYIDGWTGSDSITSTYNPTTDSTTTTTDTTTTHTNVNTGETVTSTTSTTTTTTGDTTGNPTTGEPPPPSTPTGSNPFKGKVPGASLLGLWELLVALIWYLIRLFTFVATLALIAPTEITNPYFQWFTTVQILGITPYPLVQNLALFFLGFSIYKSVRRVF